MKTLSKDALPKLPREARRLVGQGVYALYEAGLAGEDGFMLVTDAGETYYLDSEGEVTERRAQPGAPVALPLDGRLPELNL